MSSLKQLFSCCFPDHINNAMISNAEEKIDLSLSQITSMISKKEFKTNGEGQKGNGSSQAQSLLHTKGTAIFVPSTLSKKLSKTPQSQVNQIEPFPSNRIITQEEISKAPIITVKDISTKGIFTDNKAEIIINAGGLETGGPRPEKDGVVFFGLGNQSKEQELFALDVELQNLNEVANNNNATTTIETPNPFLFVICFIKETNSYQLKVSLEGSAISKNLFIKMAPSMELPIHQTEILSLGSILLCVSPGEFGELNISIVNNQLSKQTFSPLDKIVTIGRSKSCSVSFGNLKGFSKIQSTLYYNDEKKHWVLKDGSATKNSMNGTWLLGINSYQLCSDMIIDVYHSQMLISVTH